MKLLQLLSALFLACSALAQPGVDQKITIPCIFHVIHDNGSGIISKEQIEDQLSILNRDFNRLNPDTVNTPAAFEHLAGKLNIEFKLARLNPDGGCTDGVEYINSARTYNACDENRVKELSSWDSSEYLNFWIVDNIWTDSIITPLVSATPPGSGISSKDGIIMRHDVTGSIGTAQGRLGRAAVVAVAQWLGLKELFTGTPCGDDGIDDTPLVYHPASVCYDDFPYVPQGNPCGIDVSSGEMMVNYMAPSPEECVNMFTLAQIQKMLNTLYDVRSVIWSEGNLWATGTHENYNTNACKPVADFYADKRMVCVGRPVTFEDVSYNGVVSDRNWIFIGGSPVNSNSASPSVVWSQPETYPVTLEVSNAEGGDTEFKVAYVMVSPDGPGVYSNSHYEDLFSSEANFYNDWIILNHDGEHTWEHTDAISSPGNDGAIRMESNGAAFFDVDDLISSAYNLSTVSDPVLKFNYSAATVLPLNTGSTGIYNEGDRLRVYVSVDCGENWLLRKEINHEDLINAGEIGSYYNPSNGSPWTEAVVTLPSFAVNSNNVRFKFQYTSGGFGNNFYLDDIRIEGPTSIEELEKQFKLSLYPNPANENVTLSFEMPASEKVSMNLVDVTGRQIMKVYEGSLQQGAYNFNIALDNLDAGLYMLNVQYKGTNFAKKLVVN